MRRRTASRSHFAIALPVALRAEASLERIDISGYRIGTLPPEFGGSWRTGGGSPGDWQIINDPIASQGKAIVQLSADATDIEMQARSRCGRRRIP